MPSAPINKQLDEHLRETAENIISALLSAGPKMYGLNIDIKTFQELVWEAWSEKYIGYVREQLSKLSTQTLEAIDTVVEGMVDKKEMAKPMRPSKKANLN